MTNFEPSYDDWIGFYIWCSVNPWAFPTPSNTSKSIYYYIGGNKQVYTDQWAYTRALYHQTSKEIEIGDSLNCNSFFVSYFQDGFELNFNNTPIFDTAVTYYYLFAWKETADS